MSEWKGHLTATSAALLKIMSCIASGSHTISRDYQVLITASEFWAVARNGELASRMREDVYVQLSAAETAFRVIGVRRTANVIRLARYSLLDEELRASVSEVCAVIEEALSEVDEPVDQKIAEFAAAISWSLPSI